MTIGDRTRVDVTDPVGHKYFVDDVRSVMVSFHPVDVRRTVGTFRPLFEGKVSSPFRKSLQLVERISGKLLVT